MPLGENDKAFQRLERPYTERAAMLPLASIDPLFNPLRADPRCLQLLRRGASPVKHPIV